MFNRQKKKYGIGKQGKINLYYFEARFRDSNVIGKKVFINKFRVYILNFI